MSHGWLELESDPGLFTLLLEDIGVQGIQVEEIYDLQKPLEGPVYGFIFLFKWIEERRSRRKIIQEEESFVIDENIVNGMFFAKQIIANSCATHALLSVLLNCDNCKLKLGDTLDTLKKFTKDMNPEAKGFAIGNMPELARAHNSHARPEPRRLPEKQQGISAVRTREAFHFVSYVPINGRLFELDGLKPYPIDHGPWAENEDWTEKFRRVISERLGMATGGEPYHDIRFNLMAVVPDRRQQYEYKLNTLKTNRQIVLEALQQMVKVTSPEIENSSSKYMKKDPIVTRSVAAREAAAANHVPGVPASTGEHTMRTRQQKAAAAAATSTSSGSSSRSTSPPTSTPRLPPALDSHNYAKSPVNVDYPSPEDDVVSGVVNFGYNDVDALDSAVSNLDKQTDKMGLGQIRGDQLTTVKENAVKIEITVSDDNEGSISMPTTVASTDVTKPLSINTKFTTSTSPGPSSESTDTASEVGSALHSPASSSRTVSAQSSPNFCSGGEGRHLVVPHSDSSHLLLERLESRGVRIEPKSDTDLGSSGTDTLKPSMAEVKNELMKLEPSLLDGVHVGETHREGDGKSGSPRGTRSKFSSQQGFTPKDLLALLKNVESEIASCESLLRDEIEKRKRYKIDDCRRTHNYDQFICTFLSMLAEQGHLATLVEQHMLTRRRQGINIGRLHKKIPKPDRRRRSRGKKKR